MAHVPIYQANRLGPRPARRARRRLALLVGGVITLAVAGSGLGRGFILSSQAVEDGSGGVADSGLDRSSLVTALRNAIGLAQARAAAEEPAAAEVSEDIVSGEPEAEPADESEDEAVAMALADEEEQPEAEVDLADAPVARWEIQATTSYRYFVPVEPPAVKDEAAPPPEEPEPDPAPAMRVAKNSQPAEPRGGQGGGQGHEAGGGREHDSGGGQGGDGASKKGDDDRGGKGGGGRDEDNRGGKGGDGGGKFAGPPPNPRGGGDGARGGGDERRGGGDDRGGKGDDKGGKGGSDDKGGKGGSGGGGSSDRRH